MAWVVLWRLVSLGGLHTGYHQRIGKDKDNNID